VHSQPTTVGVSLLLDITSVNPTVITGANPGTSSEEVSVPVSGRVYGRSSGVGNSSALDPASFLTA
jgi:hypothetical protein